MRDDLPGLMRQLENVEFRSNKDITAYGRLTRNIGEELYLRMHFQASDLEARLKHYKGKWYHFGVSSRVKAKIVSAHLRIGAEAAKAWGIAGVKMTASFDKHFAAPERAARGAKPKRPKSDFSIDDD